MAASIGQSQAPPRMKDYVFTEKLGCGTYATVYKAYRKDGPREVVAVKCVSKNSLNKASTENLLTEIELLKSLKHKHIVHLKDFEWDQSYIYLIMEFCNAGDLSRFIRSRRILSENLTRKFLQQLALALHYMREKNISHMDLKPQNILLASNEKHNPVLKVADFGFASYLIGDTEVNHLRGSLLYMAPEIVINRHYSEKVDLWSVGVILYECLFGAAPYASKSVMELKKKITDDTPIKIPHGIEISAKARDLLLKLLVRNPEERISFNDFFTHPFVDLDHRPSELSLPRATELVTEAVKQDEAGNYPEAIRLYCQALEHFIPGIYYQQNPQKKASLRDKISQYMRRAEELKEMLKPRGAANDTSPMEELKSLSKTSVQISALIKVMEDAEKLETEEKYDKALQKYELALESAIKLIQKEPTGRRKDLLQAETHRWMTQAESVKGYLKVKDLDTSDTSMKDEEEDANFLTNHSCTLQ